MHEPSGRVKVGDRDLHRLGFGAMRVMSARGPDGTPSRNAAEALVQRAVDLGVQFIDTADIYGDGASEEIIAAALHPFPDDLLVATKGGFVPGQLQAGQRSLPPDGRPERLKRACDESLRRLGLETIGLYQLHTPDPAVPFEDSVGALVELRAAGKIVHIGLSNVGRRQISHALELTPIVTVQNRYNAGDRSSERVLELCEQHGIVFLPWGPLQAGDATAVAEVATELGVTRSQVALAWLLYRSPLMLPIPGTSSIAHLEENFEASGVRLSDAQFARLQAQASGC